MKNFLNGDGKSDAFIGALAVGCLVLAMLPFMPGDISMVLVGIFIALFALFSVLIWREQPRDEREQQIIMASDRLGFLAGAVTVTLLLIVQTLRHQETFVLVVILFVMIIVKLLGKYLHK